MDSSVVRASDSWSKGPGFKFRHERRDNFLLQGQLFVLTLISVSAPPPCYRIARKRSRSFCQKSRWQVTAKHAYILSMWLWKEWHCKLVHGWMVYTEPAPRTCAFHVAPAMQQPKSATSTPVHHFHHALWKDKVTLSESYATCAQWVFSRAELNSYINLKIIIIMKVKINWGKIQRTTPFFVDLQFVSKILDRCSTSSKVHSHENNPWQKCTCIFIHNLYAKLRASSVLSRTPKVLSTRKERTSLWNKS